MKSVVLCEDSPMNKSLPRESHLNEQGFVDKEAGKISGMFDKIAPRYDLANDVLSFGQVRLWRKAVLVALDIHPGQRILDIACGTGTSTAEYEGFGARVVGIDFSSGMLEKARKTYPHITFQQADTTALPFDDESFDTVTCSYGLRNVEEPQKALNEMRRVLRPGGRVVVAEFSHPESRVFGTVYDSYLRHILPRVAGVVAKSVSEYAYLMESIGAWPDQLGVAQMLHHAGLNGVEYRNLTGGIVAIHRAFAPTMDIS